MGINIDMYKDKEDNNSEESIKLYENMIEDINSAIKKLTNAKDEVNEVCESINQYYQCNMTNEKISILKMQYNTMNNIIKKLESKLEKITDEINSKKSISSLIKKKR